MKERKEILKSRITEIVRKKKRPLSFEDILHELDLTKKDSRLLKRILREMFHEGRLIKTRKGHYGPPEEMNLVTGYFEAHRDGYGFVIPEKAGERDIFIPMRFVRGAMNNDRVIARLEDTERRSGSILRILERATRRVTGIFDRTRYGTFVKPRNRSIFFDILIPQGETGGARKGDYVVVDIMRYPQDNRPATGRVIKIIKKPETPLEEIQAIMDEFNIQKRFPEEVLKEARLIVKKAIDLKNRKDLTGLTTITIDGERAKDFDDAVSIERIPQGYRLYVHIADVSYYVPWDSKLDMEARKRATSIYFPDMVIPMLPPELSEDICSLKPSVTRAAFTVDMVFNEDGERLSTHFYPSIIKSRERMTYTSIKKIVIDNDMDERIRYSYLLRDIELMAELASILREMRLKRGSLDFDLPEPEVLLDIQGNPENIIRSERTFAHMIIEEFMIAANEAVSEYIESTEVPSLYRIHEKPDPNKIAEISKLVHLLTGKRLKEAKNLHTIIKDVKGKPYEETVNYIILKSLKQARYSHINAGHFGLASSSYTHFTSPIRRYPDLVVHRILKDIITGRINDRKIKYLENILPNIAFHSSRMERRADESENTVVQAMRIWFMKKRIGDTFRGNIVSVTLYGVKVRLMDFYVEGFLHVSYMTDDFYIYDESTFTLRGKRTGRRLSIGDEIIVRLQRIDEVSREIIFGI